MATDVDSLDILLHLPLLAEDKVWFLPCLFFLDICFFFNVLSESSSFCFLNLDSLLCCSCDFFSVYLSSFEYSFPVFF